MSDTHDEQPIPTVSMAFGWVIEILLVTALSVAIVGTVFATRLSRRIDALEAEQKRSAGVILGVAGVLNNAATQDSRITKLEAQQGRETAIMAGTYSPLPSVSELVAGELPGVVKE